jgi:cytochrome c
VKRRLAVLVFVSVGACGRSEPEGVVLPGDPERGRHVIARVGCGACHRIDGIPGAVSSVGPSLDQVLSRRYIAGQVPNTTGNLLRFIRMPQATVPKTAMPDLNLSDREARDVVAYLHTQR